MKTRRICIVKVGSAVVTTDNGQLDTDFLFQVCQELSQLREVGWLPILVSSGAKVTGRGIVTGHNRFLTEQSAGTDSDALPMQVRTALSKRDRMERKGASRQYDHQKTPLAVADVHALSFRDERRVLASIGQAQLISTYAGFLKKMDSLLIPAQLLLTRQALADRSRYIDIRNTINDMVENNILPIINNNDVTHAKKVDFIDNDQVATYVAGMINAETVLFVSDAGGVYNKNPKVHHDAEVIESLSNDSDLWPEILIDDSISSFGGMTNKLVAIKTLSMLGIAARVASKAEPDVIFRGVNDPDAAFGTHLAGQPRQIGNLKRWLAAGAFPAGMIFVSEPGASAFLNRQEGKSLSLLDVGVTDVRGTFVRGDPIVLIDQEFEPIALGRTRLSSAELRAPGEHGKSRIVVHANDMFAAPDIAFLGTMLRQMVEGVSERVRLEGYRVVENKAGLGDDNRGGVVRVSNRFRAGEAVARDDREDNDPSSDVVFTGREAREVFHESKKALKRLGISQPDEWVLYRAFN